MILNVQQQVQAQVTDAIRRQFGLADVPAFARLLALFNVPAKIEVTSCRAHRGQTCGMTVTIEQE